METTRCKITINEVLSPNCKRIVLKPISPKRFEFISGMFASISFDKDGKHFGPRPFSVANAPPSDELEFIVKRGWELSTALCSLDIDQEVDVLGPVGKFLLRDPKKELTLIAGGTGIAPLISMMRSAVATSPRILLVYSCKTQKDILMHDELKHMMDKDNVSIVITLTRESWDGHTGRISEEMLRNHVHRDSDCYICGPSGFVDDAETCLLALGLPEERLFRERW